MNSTKLCEYIINLTNDSIIKQNRDGSMPAGHNGPWNNIDTPVRNTAHWAITFCEIYKLTKDNRFLEAAFKAAEYLLSKQARPGGVAYLCRIDENKNFSNGLIGQAWAIESLSLLYKCLGIEKCRIVAEEVFISHPFNYKLGLWNAIDIYGEPLPVHRTYNQQLWFALSGILLLSSGINNELIKERVGIYLSNLVQHTYLEKDGVINHRIWFTDKHADLKRKIKGTLTDISLRLDKNYSEISAGYHSFNLYAYGMIKKYYSGYVSFFDSNIFRQVKSNCLNNNYLSLLNTNKFAFKYNPTGFEIAYFCEMFELNKNGNEIMAKDLLEKQLCFYNDKIVSSNIDYDTLFARIYEATRLNEFNLQYINGES